MIMINMYVHCIINFQYYLLIKYLKVLYVNSRLQEYSTIHAIQERVYCYQYLALQICKIIQLCLTSLQDEANKHGGKWIIRLKKGLASRCWENLILAMLGEQFMVGEEICGAVISIRYQVRILIMSQHFADFSV